MSDLSLLKTQLENLRKLDVVAKECKLSDLTDFTIVETTYNGVTFRCLLGEYQHQHGGINSQEHFGVDRAQSGVLFGALTPLNHRMMLIWACIDEREQQIEMAEKQSKRAA